MDEDGDYARVEFAALDRPRFAGDLEEEPRGQKDEEHEGDEHRTPVLHLLLPPLLLWDDDDDDYSSQLQLCF